MTRTLELIAAGLWVLAALTTIVLGARRLALSRRERRRDELERALRPVALEIIDGEAVEVGELDRARALTLAAILERYARKLRGEARARIAEFFEGRGEVERELRELRSRRAVRRAAAAFTLGDMGSRTAIPALIAALDDRSRDVRAAAARSLGRLEAELAVPRLVRSLAAREVPRAVAAHALLSIGGGAAPHLRALAEPADAGARPAPDRPPTAVPDRPRTAAPDVARAAAAGEAEERAVALELLGYAGEAHDGALLAGGLGDPAPEVRAAAARALGRLARPGVGAEALRAALEDPVAFVRTTAAHALGAIGGRDAVDALARQACEPDYDAARAAATALAAISPRALTALAEAPEASVHVREAAALLELDYA